MAGIAVQVLAQLRVAEGWSAGSVAGAVALVILVLGVLATAFLVGRRR